MKSKSATQIIKTLRDKGFEAYFVGGCVRDMIMGIKPIDYDIATDARPEEVMDVFPRTEPIGVQFGVILVIHHGIPFEVSTFRSDEGYLDGRRPTGVVFTNAREDVFRRDFTINGLLYDPITEQIIDHVGGQADIEQGIVRAIGDPQARFDEDKLRILRAIRFSARFDYRIEEKTWKAVGAMAAKIHFVSAERIRDELLRILTEGNAAYGVKLLEESGLLSEMLPEITWGDYFEKCLKMLQPDARADFAASVFLHRCSIEDVRAITNRLRFSKAESMHIASLIRQQIHFVGIARTAEYTLKRFLRQDRFRDHLELHRVTSVAGGVSMEDYEFVRAKLEEWSIEDLKPDLLISGDDLIALGIDPGPLFKTILTSIENEQLEGRIKTREEALDLIREEWLG